MNPENNQSADAPTPECNEQRNISSDPDDEYVLYSFACTLERQRDAARAEVNPLVDALWKADTEIARLTHELENVWKPAAAMNEQYARAYETELADARREVETWKRRAEEKEKPTMALGRELEAARDQLAAVTRERDELKIANRENSNLT